MTDKQKQHIERLAELRRGSKCVWMTGRKHSDETKKKIGNGNKGKRLGKKMKESSLIKRSISLKEAHSKKEWGFKKGVCPIILTGDKNPNWRGGVTGRDRSIRTSKEYKDWRVSVFKRDKYTCQECGAKSKRGATVIIEAHHKKPFATHHHLRFELSNGITLCKECHNKKPKGIKVYEHKIN